MRLAGAVIGSQLRITERVIEIDLHRYRKSRVMILAPNHCLHMERKTLLLVREIGQLFGLNSASPLEIVEAFLRALPASSLGFDSVALALTLFMPGAKRLDLNEKWRGRHRWRRSAA
jgi:hypothetical protein